MKHLQFSITITLLLTYAMSAVTYSQQPQSNAVPAPSTSLVPKIKLDTSLWKEELSKIATKENAAILFPIWYSVPIPNMSYAQPRGIEAMEALAWATGTRWIRVGKTYVFMVRERNIHDFQAELNHISAWISSLPAKQLTTLLYGRIPFNVLDAKTRRALLISQYDSDMQFVLLDKAQQATVHLELIPTIKLVGEKKELPFQPMVYLNPLRLLDTSLRLTSTNVSLDAPTKIQTNTSGILNFGDGEVLSMKELKQKAGEAFGKNYSVKAGNSEKLYFVSGRYDPGSFEDAVKAAASPKKLPPVSQSQPIKTLPSILITLAQQRPELKLMKVDTGNLRGDWAAKEAIKQGNPDVMQDILNDWAKTYGALEAIDLDDFLHDKEKRVDLLVRERPGLAKELESNKINLDDKVTMTMSYQITIQAPGEHESSMVPMLKDGKFVRRKVSNVVKFILQ